MNFPIPETLTAWLALAALIVLAVSIGFAAKYGIKLADVNLKGTIYDFLRTKAKTFVAALMQDPTLEGLASEEKKQRAMLWLMKTAEEYRIPLTQNEASQIIEEAVYLLKNVALSTVGDALNIEPIPS